MLKLYADALRKTPGSLAKTPWALLVPMLLGVVRSFAFALVAPLGEVVGGILMALIDTALASSFLYVVAELVSGSGLRTDEVVPSLQRYFWPVMNVRFVFWIASFFVGPVLRNMPPGATLGLYAVLLILLNVVPEVIYLRRSYGGMEILGSSIQFIQENWIEWFIPNLPLGLAYMAFNLFGGTLLHLVVPGPLATIAEGLIEGAFLLPYFIFRGHLFQGLSGGSRRARAWAARQ